ncbi:hypothetical protein AAE478_007220 [Parahypoxylon ruwenzoriense]
MSGTQKLPFEILSGILKHLPVRDRATLGLANKALWAESHEKVLEEVLLYNWNSTEASQPLLYAIINGHVDMLSTIYEFLEPVVARRSWWYLLSNVLDLKKVFGERVNSLKYLGYDYTGFTLSLCCTKSVGFILDSLDLLPLDIRCCDWRYMVCMRGDELLPIAIGEDYFDTVDFLLDRPHLFSAMFKSESLWEGRIEFGCSASMAEHLISRGYEPTVGALWHMCTPTARKVGSFGVLVRNGCDVDGAVEYERRCTTPLLEACYWGNPAAIEALLRLGADPNGVEPVRKRKESEKLDGFVRWHQMTRPIDVRSSDLISLSPSWKTCAKNMYACIVPLIEHGASTSHMPHAGDPVKSLLRGVWRMILPRLKNALGIDTYDKSWTLEDFFEVLPRAEIDIGPLDELCDIVVDATPEYSAKAEGLRGKERMVVLFRQVEDIYPVEFSICDWTH